MTKQRRAVPHDTELEEALIGALLTVPPLIGEAISTIGPQDLLDPLWQAVFAEMVEKKYGEGRAIDLHTLAAVIAPKFPKVDVRETLLRALEGESMPTKGVVVEYCRMLSEMARKRRLIQIAGEIAEVGYDDTYAEEAEARALSLVLDASKGREVGAYVAFSKVVAKEGVEIVTNIEYPQEILGLDSGLATINLVLGGLQPTHLIIIGGRPSMGKSSLATTLALNVARSGHKVALNSLEMGEKRLTLRLVSSLSGVPAEKIRKGKVSDEEKHRVFTALGDLERLPIFLDCRTSVTSMRVAATARQLAGSKGLDLLIVDYLGLLADRDEYEVRRLGTITRTLKAVAMDLNIPVIALHQLSRRLEHRQNKVPMLADLRDSGRIEEDADVVLFIHRDDYYQPQPSEGVSMCDLVVAKNRDGRTGRFGLAFDRTRLTFHDVEHRDE